MALESKNRGFRPSGVDPSGFRLIEERGIWGLVFLGGI